MSTLKFEANHIKDLQVASEGMGHVIDKVYSGLVDNTKKFSTYLKDLLPTVKNVVNDSKKELDLESVPSITKDQTKFLEVANKYPFQEMREIKAWKPEGSNCTYLEFTNTLDSQIDRAITISNDVLNPYALLLAKITSNDGSIKSLDTNKTYLTKLSTSRDKLISDIAKLYKTDSVESVTIVGKVIERNNDWENVITEVNRVVTKMNQVNIKDLLKEVEICEHYLDELINDSKAMENINISPEVIKQLADYTYQVAKEIEFVAITHFRVLTLKGSVENTMEQIIDVKG